MNTSHAPVRLFLDGLFKATDYGLSYGQTLHSVSKRSPSRTVKAEFLKPIKYVVKEIVSLYRTYKPEVQLVTCASEYFNTRIRNLLQQDTDQRISAPKHTNSHLARKPYTTSQMVNPNVRNFKTFTDTGVYRAMNNLKHYDENSTGRNIESLEGVLYQVVHECLEVVAHFVPGLRTLLQAVYEAWDWGMQLTEFVNRNKLALCIRKFTEKKFWVWIETDRT
jgi:hypothetical protein